MTRISDYLNAEQLDPTEPVSFYAPGGEDDPHHALAARRVRRSWDTRRNPTADDVEAWDGHEE